MTRFPKQLGEGFDADSADRRANYREERAREDLVEKQLACKHDYDKAVRIGRAHWICPKCKTDIHG